MNNVMETRLVVVLDTNSVHYLDLFMRAALERGITVENIENEALIGGLYTTDRGYNKSLDKGKKIVSFILRKDVQIELSQVAKIELLCGRVRGAAIVSAAKEGIPDRMWSRINEVFIRDRTEADLVAIKNRVENLGASLESWGVIVVAGSEQQRTTDVLELAMAIVGYVYMSVADSIVYASAIAARADILITADRYLHDTINLIHNPSGRARYQDIKDELGRLCDGDFPQARSCAGL